MKFYCGIDLSARECHVCVIDQQLKIVVQQKLRNELPKICQLLAPYQANLKIVVESTFNWYWLMVCRLRPEFLPRSIGFYRRWLRRIRICSTALVTL